jgi:hypothetical protein
MIMLKKDAPEMMIVFLIFFGVAALGAVCYWRRATPQSLSIHTVVTEPHDKSAPLSMTNLPQGSRLGAHSGRAAAILTDGTVLTGSAGNTKTFPNLAAYRDYVGDPKALLFGDQPA